MSVERVEIDQALVTVGGKGSKLRQGGFDFPLSKSFIELEGKPLFYWCLREMLKARVSRLVIVAETQEKLRRADEVIEEATAGYNLRDVVHFQDNGYGTNGLPYYARELLDDEFIFEFGHKITEASVYNEMRKVKTPDTVVYSGFEPNGYSEHATIQINMRTGSAEDQESQDTKPFAIAAPFILDQAYITRIPSYGFRFLDTVNAQVRRNGALVVFSRLPIDIDVPKEFEETIPIYQRFIRETGSTTSLR